MHTALISPPPHMQRRHHALPPPRTDALRAVVSPRAGAGVPRPANHQRGNTPGPERPRGEARHPDRRLVGARERREGPLNFELCNTVKEASYTYATTGLPKTNQMHLFLFHSVHLFFYITHRKKHNFVWIRLVAFSFTGLLFFPSPIAAARLRPAEKRGGPRGPDQRLHHILHHVRPRRRRLLLLLL